MSAKSSPASAGPQTRNIPSPKLPDAIHLRRETFLIVDIHVGKRLRKIDPGKVMQLADSIREMGIMHLPAIYISDGIVMDTGETRNNVPVLISGQHRIEALKLLGREQVACEVYDTDAATAELMQIDENLCRANLTPAQEAYHIARRKEIYEALHPETRQGANNQHTAASRQIGELQPARFTVNAAQATGKSERSVQRDAERGEALGENLNRITGTSLDKGVELDALIKMPQTEREAVIARAEAGEDVTARIDRSLATSLPANRGDTEGKIVHIVLTEPSEKPKTESGPLTSKDLLPKKEEIDKFVSALNMIEELTIRDLRGFPALTPSRVGSRLLAARLPPNTISSRAIRETGIFLVALADYLDEEKRLNIRQNECRRDHLN